MPAIFTAMLFATAGEIPQAVRLPEPIAGPRLVCVYVIEPEPSFYCFGVDE